MVTRHRATAPAAASLWGDGFAEDGLRDLWAVRDWSLCCPDEYIFLFPRLIPPPGELPHPLRAHLESCVRARTWRLAHLARGKAPPPLRSRVPDSEAGSACHGDWFVDGGAMTCLLRQAGLLHTAPERVEAERDLLAFLDGLLADVQAQRSPAWDETFEALLAFGAGIHPAYLWPQASMSPARGVAAGWLGHLDRGRTALMPLVVAEYVLDALGAEGACDRQLVGLAGSAANLELLRRAARRRWSGQDAAVRLPSGAASLWGVSSGRTRSAAEACA